MSAAGRHGVSLWIMGAALLAAGLYANALTGPFLYDDVVEIRDNERVHSFSNIPTLLASDFWGSGKGHNPLYRPLTAVTTTAVYVLGGGRPFPFHLLNLLLHAGASALCVLLLFELTGSLPISAISGMLFAAHPVHTEAVAWISGEAELLSSLFVMLAWLAHLRGWTPMAFVSICLGLLSKEGAVIFPALALVGDLLSGREWLRRWRAYGLYAAAVAAYLALRLRVLGHLLGGESAGPPLLNPLKDASAVERVLTSLAVFGQAIAQSLFPKDLCLDYGYNQIPVASGLLDPSLLAGIAMLFGMGLSVWLAGTVSRRLQLVAALGAAIFLITFLPASNLLFPAISIFAERNLYLPVLGFCLMAAALIAAPAARAAPLGVAEPRGAGGSKGRSSTATRGAHRMAGWRWAIAGTLALLLGARTIARNAQFDEGLSLYGAAVKACPRSARAHLFHGIRLREVGRTQDAISELRASLAIAPAYSDARGELGMALAVMGEYGAAERELSETLRVNPEDREARSNLGWLYAETNRLTEALLEYRRLVQMFPGDPEVLNNYASTLIDTGDPASLVQAGDIYRRLEQEEPTSPHGPNGLGALHAREERWDLAAQKFEEALRRKPGDINATSNLASALAKNGQTERALLLLEEAIASGINDPALLRLRESLRASLRR